MPTKTKGPIMKYLFTSLFGLFSLMASAQSIPVDSLAIQRADIRAAILMRMTDDLVLNTAQQAQVAGVLLVRSEAIAALPAAGQQRETGVHQANTIALGQLQEILTIAQMQIYLQLRQELIQAQQQYGVTSIDDQLDF
jgi:hypothetical protein